MAPIALAKIVPHGYSRFIMIGFFIKKAFFDGWDNLLGLVGYNLGYLVVLLGAYGALEVLAVSSWLGIALLIVVSALNSAYSGTVSYLVKQYAWYQKPAFAEIKMAFLDSWRHSVLHFLINTMLLLVAFVVLPFYLSAQSMLMFAIAVVLFWVALACLMAMMYYFPLAAQMPRDNPRKTLKKSFMVLGDNMGFSIFLGLYSIVGTALTVVFATIIPGVAGMSLGHQVAMKLLMFKYDYLEEHPDTKKRQVPWEELLFEERERVGKRTLRGMIFPWKE